MLNLVALMDRRKLVQIVSTGAALVEFKQLLRLTAALPHVHHVVHYQVLTAERAVPLVVADIRQLFVPVFASSTGIAFVLAIMCTSYVDFIFHGPLEP